MKYRQIRLAAQRHAKKNECTLESALPHVLPDNISGKKLGEVKKRLGIK